MFRDDDQETAIADEIYNRREENSQEAGENRERTREEEQMRRQGGQSGSLPPEPSGSGEEGELGSAVFTQVEDVQRDVRSMTQSYFNETRILMTVTSKVFSIWVDARSKGGRVLERYAQWGAGQ